MERKASFANRINQMVVIGCGVAFLIIYVICAILLYIAEPEISEYYGKAIPMFVIYLAIYLLVSWYMTYKIKEMFAPLDQIAVALVEKELNKDSDSDDIQSLANSLKEQMEKMNSISKELRDTKNSFDNICAESIQSKTQMDEMMALCKNQCEKAIHKCEKLQERENKEKEIMERLENSSHGLKINKKTLYEDTTELKNCIKDSRRSNMDAKDDIIHLKESFEVLSDMLNDSASLIEEVYSEITMIQTETTRTNLYAMNASLDAARSGIYHMGTVSTLDEIKDMTGKINNKTDKVQLLTIRSRNSVKLAMDQADYCVEKEGESNHSFSITGEKLETVSQQIQGIMEITDVVMDEIVNVTTDLYELSQIKNDQEIEVNSIKKKLIDISDKLRAMLDGVV